MSGSERRMGNDAAVTTAIDEDVVSVQSYLEEPTCSVLTLQHAQAVQADALHLIAPSSGRLALVDPQGVSDFGQRPAGSA